MSALSLTSALVLFLSVTVAVSPLRCKDNNHVIITQGHVTAPRAITWHVPDAAIRLRDLLTILQFLGKEDGVRAEKGREVLSTAAEKET